MPIPQPSQYQCDRMENGDVVFVRSVSWLYKLIRRLFYKDKPTIRVRKDWTEPAVYNTYYQEDCTLMYRFEVQCVQTMNDVPCMLSKRPNSRIEKVFNFKSVQVGIYNIQIEVDNNTTFTFPTSYIDNAMRKNQLTLKNIEDERKIAEAIKFQKYKGAYFKKYAAENNITEWTPVYCATCGEPVIFRFNETGVHIDKMCSCGIMKLNLTDISYDEFALWYTNQAASPEILERYNEFWFKR